MDEFDDLFGPPAEGRGTRRRASDGRRSMTFSGLPRKKQNRTMIRFLHCPRELPMRTWVDNTGHYEVEARLVVIMVDSVRLLKENGRTTTVPMSRLSDGDRDYVEQMIAQIGYGELGQFAAR
jgi:hypothetical protein